MWVNKLYPILFFLLLVTVLSCGCWDWNEINTLTIVSGVGVDEAQDEPGKINLTAQVVKSGALRGGGMDGTEESGGAGEFGTEKQAVQVITSTGETVFQAICNLTTKTTHKIFFSHTQVFIIGGKTAERGIYRFLDIVARNPQARPKSQLLITEGEAAEILRHSEGVESIPAFGIFRAVKSASEHAFIPEATLQESFRRLATGTTDPVAPLAQVYKEKGFDGKSMKKVRISGTAIFRGDRMVGTLNLRETRGLLWILGKVKTGIIVVEHAGKKESLDIINAHSKINPEIRNRRLLVRISIDVKCNLAEQQSIDNLIIPGTISALEKKQAAVIRGEVFGAIKRAQSLDADIFGFGEEYYRKYPHEWQRMKPRWRDLFPGIEVQVDVKSRIRETGAISEPIYRKK